MATNDPYDTPIKGENDFIYNFKAKRYSVDHPLPEANILYKYYSGTKLSFDALINNYFYLSHPFNFNDSVDSSELFWNFENLSFQDFKNFYGGNSAYSEAELKGFFESDKENKFQSIRRNFFLNETKKVGIVSLTNNPLNILMWGHYSGENGFMIEIDKNFLLSDIFKLNRPALNNYILYPINYVEELKTINLPGKFKSADVPFLYSFGTKLTSWSYEKEWRLICFIPDMTVPLSKVSALKPDIPGTNERKIFYPKQAIKKIVLGKTFFNKSFVSKVESSSPEKPITYTLRHSETAKFLNHIAEEYPDRIFLSGTIVDKGILKRSFERIVLKKKKFNVFESIRTSEVRTL